MPSARPIRYQLESTRVRPATSSGSWKLSASSDLPTDVAVRLREISGVDSDSEVTGFAIDHRKVAPGSIFGAFKGAVFNGEDFIPDAVTRGAVAVVARPEVRVEQAVHLADQQPLRP